MMVLLLFSALSSITFVQALFCTFWDTISHARNLHHQDF